MKKQFQFKVDLETLIDMDGIDGLNNHLDDAMNAANLTEMATDIAYKVIGLDGETILIEATYTPEVDELEVEEDDDYPQVRLVFEAEMWEMRDAKDRYMTSFASYTDAEEWCNNNGYRIAEVIGMDEND